jgi:luciferase family oxidoreductase group 1
VPRLRVGVLDQSPVATGATAEEAVARTLELARHAESLGYSRYWLAEHHSTNSFAGASPEVLAARVASVTERIRVGSGGVMLSHYSPLKVAEQFRMLEALFPGRIDLGLGRAPGGVPLASHALAYGREPFGPGVFPQQVRDLLAWLTESHPERHPFSQVRAMPRVASLPEVWMLGSGGDTAPLAGELGIGYAFARFISGLDPASAIGGYREGFRASSFGERPRAMLCVGVICADTADEASRLASSLTLWRQRIGRGRDRGIPSPEEALAELGALDGDPVIEPDRTRVIVGDPKAVGARLADDAEAAGVEEVMVVTVTHDHEARLRSYALLAEALELRPG